MRDRGSRQQEFDSRFDAVFQPGFAEADAEGDETALQRIGIDDRARTAAVGGDAQTAPVRRHPLVDRFVVVLWLVGAGLLTVGIVGITSLVLGFDRTSSQITPDYMILVIVTQVSPWLIAVGLATLIGTLFLLAARWERRP